MKRTSRGLDFQNIEDREMRSKIAMFPTKKEAVAHAKEIGWFSRDVERGWHNFSSFWVIAQRIEPGVFWVIAREHVDGIFVVVK